MTTVYLDQRGARLSHSGGALEVRLPDDSIQRVPLAQLGRLIVASEADISVGLLRQLAQARVPLVVLRGRSRADAAMLWPQLGDAQRRLAQRRAADDSNAVRRLAALTIGLRIRGQRRLLDELRQAQPRSRYAATRVMRALERIRQGLPAHRDVSALRGAEGAAARLYFFAYAHFLPKACGFEGRRRRPPTDPVNAALSLGYSLLHGRAVECCHTAGLDAAIGALHDPAHNRPSLACDLVEPERVAIERFVRNAFSSGLLQPSDFVDDANGVLLGKSARGAYFAGIEPVLAACARRMSRRTRALVRWLDQRHREPPGAT
jgi:CRISPR-associated protein Cas1